MDWVINGDDTKMRIAQGYFMNLLIGNPAVVDVVHLNSELFNACIELAKSGKFLDGISHSKQFCAHNENGLLLLLRLLALANIISIAGCLQALIMWKIKDKDFAHKLEESQLFDGLYTVLRHC